MSKSIEGSPTDSEQVDAQPTQAQSLKNMPSFEEHMNQISKKVEQADTIDGVYDSGKKETSYDFASPDEIQSIPDPELDDIPNTGYEGTGYEGIDKHFATQKDAIEYAKKLEALADKLEKMAEEGRFKSPNPTLNTDLDLTPPYTPDEPPEPQPDDYLDHITPKDKQL